MKSIVRCLGVKSPTVGCTCESMRPGSTVVPFASMTVSASLLPTSPPTASIRPSTIEMTSPSMSGMPRSPETIWPIPVMTVRIAVA